MPLWPKSFYFIGENLATARVARKLRRKHGAAAAQDKVFSALIPRLAATTFWRESGVESGMRYEEFRARIAPRSYEQLGPAIERMRRGESDVLWPGRTVFFAKSAGTTGPAKLLPVTEDLLVHFRHAVHESFLYYTARIGHAGVARGRYLTVGGSTALARLAETNGHEVYGAELAGILALATPAWAEKHLLEPAAAISQIADWDEKVRALATKEYRRDVALLASNPNCAGMLASALREKSAAAGRAANLQAVWPNLECYMHGGLSIAPYYDGLREALGPGVKFHEVYFSTEAIIAAQDREAGAGMRPLADCGVFFEFVPWTEFEHATLDHLGPKAVPLSGVKADVDYVILITTPGGLVRYSPGDIVRFNSVTPPRLIHIGRTELSVRAAGECVLEKDLTDALIAVCKRHSWSITNFHVAPLVTTLSTGAVRGHHEWWIELRPGTVATPTGPQMAGELDLEMRRLNARYAARRNVGALESPVVRLVMPGVFEHWLRHCARWGGNSKTPRSRNDRQIADELAQITCFAQD
jgi:hypothetical protein